MMPAARNPSSRWLARATLCLIVPLLLAGCGTLALTYNHADRFLLWKIDRYFQLSHEQERLVQGRLADLHSWHRKAELPRYLEFLRDVQGRWRDGLTAEEIDATFDSFQRLRAELAQRVAAEGAVFLATLDARQIRHLERVVQRENRELQVEVGTTAEERSVRRVRKVLGWLREWLGRLSPEQEHRIAQLIRAVPDDTEARSAYRVQRQQEFVRLLQAKPHPAVIEHSLRDWLAVPERNSPPVYARSVQYFQQDVKQVILEIDHTVTPSQRMHASEKLQRVTHDIHALAAS